MRVKKKDFDAYWIVGVAIEECHINHMVTIILTEAKRLVIFQKEYGLKTEERRN